MGGVIGDVLPLTVGVAISPMPIIAVLLMLLASRAVDVWRRVDGRWRYQDRSRSVDGVARREAVARPATCRQ